jgi:hypothetical protein
MVDSLRDGDSIALLQYSDKAEMVREWSQEKAQISKAIKRTNFGKKSAFAAALRLAVTFFAKRSLENKHLVLITDGTDNKDTAFEKASAIRHLLGTDISVHILSYTAMEAANIEPRTKRYLGKPISTIGTDDIRLSVPNRDRIDEQRSRLGPKLNFDRSLINKMKHRMADLMASQKQLDTLAKNTNGEFVLPYTFDEMEKKSRWVARMIGSSYVVTYSPKSPITGSGIVERRISVLAKRSGLIVHAREKLFINQAN